MRSRTSLFNATLFKKTIVRFWPVWFLYAFVWLLAFPAGIGGALVRSLRMEDPAAAVLYVIAGRPLDAALLVTIGLGARRASPRVVCAVEPYPGRWTQHVLVADTDDLDDELLCWLDEAYAFSMAK